jgi:hypothetical protein
MVDKCTSTELRQPDMDTMTRIQNEINQTPDFGKTAAFQIRKRILTNDPKIMFLSLGLLDMCMDKCPTSFHKQIGTKDFI